MRFLVFGAGALGSLFGGLLSKVHPVTIVGRPPHVEAIRTRGLRIGGLTQLLARPEAFTDLEGVQPPDVVLLTVKAYDTETAMEALRPYWPESIFLSLQNGLGNEDVMAKRARKVLGGVTSQGVTFVGPGEVFHAGAGETFVGPYHGAERGDATELVEAFRSAGIPCELSDNIQRDIWLKTLVNACINPLTALLRVKNGRLLDSYPLGEAVEILVEEGIMAAAARGVELQKEEVMGRVWKTAHATADNKSSMLQDLERGRPTEIDYINGAVARLGQEKGISCPANSLLALLIKGAEKGPRRDSD